MRRKPQSVWIATWAAAAAGVAMTKLDRCSSLGAVAADGMKGRHLYMDNYYTSLRWLRALELWIGDIPGCGIMKKRMRLGVLDLARLPKRAKKTD